MIRPLAILAILACLLAIPTTTAAADCRMTATVVPGSSIQIAGSGWPANAGVTLVVIRDGTEDSSQQLVADAGGSFSTSLPAGPGRGGAYTLVATSGSCKAVADVVAVETAGGVGGTAGGGVPSPPATDAVASTGSRTVPGLPVASLLAILVAACLGLLVRARHPGSGTHGR